MNTSFRKTWLSFSTPPNALHIREISAKAADLMFKAGFKTIRLGLETADFSDHRHDIKVKRNEFFTAVEHLRMAGFATDQLGAYLLCGLPDQNLDEVEASINLVKRLGITPVLAYYTPIPHTPMWEDAVKKCPPRYHGPPGPDKQQPVSLRPLPTGPGPDFPIEKDAEITYIPLI